MDEFTEILIEKELKLFNSVIGDETDLVILLLRGHLYSENLLERIILVELLRGDKIIENGNLTYNHKLLLVDSLGFTDDRVISSLRNLNKLRNLAAHKLNKNITMEDITKVGSSLGKKFTEIKRNNKMEEVKVFRSLLIYICGFLSGYCSQIEHPDIDFKE